MSEIEGFHHVTSCVEGAQEDIDFYTGTLGARLIKQTVLLDGNHGVYHLYYSSEGGSPGNVLTSFPYKQRGIRGRRGTGQVKTIALSIPASALEFWAERLDRLGIAHDNVVERFGRPTLAFEHPAGLGFELVEDHDDERRPWTTAEIAEEYAIRGMRSVTLSLRDTAESEAFMTELGFAATGRDGRYTRFEIGAGGPAHTIDFLHEPDVPAGSWTYAAGTVHHIAFAVKGDQEQLDLKARLEGLGFVDVSEVKNRNYFRAIYMRMPGGVLFEFATNEPGFAIDEPADRLGQRLLFPEWYDDRRDELLAQLEPINPPTVVG
jgi:glyoxalase family protein